MDKNLKNILDKIPIKLNNYFRMGNVTEIRLSAGKKVKLCIDGKYVFADKKIMEQKDIDSVFMKLCDYTLSAYQDQISQGFITLSGGHRVGIGGKFIKSEDVYILNTVTSLIIRIASVAEYKYDKSLICFDRGLLIAGPPHSGKTTLLKNICANTEYNTVVCDERNEFYNCPGNVEVISGLNKTQAIGHAVRSMNPQLVICDEIGSVEEAEQLLAFMNTGVRFICSVHADSVDKLWMKPNIKLLLDNKVFDKIAVISGQNNFFCIREMIDV